MGVKTKIIKTDMDNQWDPDISNIEKCINVNTKIICLNYPNNPTGKILSERKMQSIVNLAEKYNIIILSDEVYSNFSYCKFTSILDFPIKNAILIGSFSKTFSMTGFRVGFAYSTNIDIVNKLIKVQSLALTSVPEPMQYCALAAISCDPMPYANTMKKRLDFLCSKLKKMPFEFVYPDGAMYVYAKIKDCVRVDDLKLTEKLLDKGVAVAPGRGFGNDYKQYIRISACIDEAKLNLGLDLISSVVNSL
jgi:aspartate aminotransferase